MTAAAPRPIWLVLGASSAIARAFARAAAAEGANVLLAGRDRSDLQASAADLKVRYGVEAEVLPFDAEDSGGHAAFAAAVEAAAGEAELNIFLAFGSMPSQAEIDRDFALAERTVRANYLGAMSVLQAFAPLLEAKGRGRVVALSSVAGDRGRIKNYVYGSAKAGLNAYLQGLRARLFRAGVFVTTVKPGFVDTAMTFGLPGMFLVASPQAVAARALKAALAGREEVYAPAFWWAIMTIMRNIPERIFKRLGI